MSNYNKRLQGPILLPKKFLWEFSIIWTRPLKTIHQPCPIRVESTPHSLSRPIALKSILLFPSINTLDFSVVSSI
jgi:hypothetical protein